MNPDFSQPQSGNRRTGIDDVNLDFLKSRTMNVFRFLIAVACIVNCTVVLAQTSNEDSGVVTIERDQVVKIWGKANHSAFTDLVRFKDEFYCSFREATGHAVSKGQKDGKVRIVKSKDGKDWTSLALLAKKGLDLRDPKLSVTPDGRLMVIMGGSVYREGKMLERFPQIAFSDQSGANFTDPQNVVIDPKVQNDWDWIWRVTWNNGIGYAINWQLQNWESGRPTGTLFLMKTNDGIHFEKVSYLEACGYPNESTIRFDENNRMYVLIRRERGDDGAGIPLLATATSPYKKWSFQRLSEVGRIGGPNFIFLDKNTIVLAGRAYDGNPGAYTRVEVMDLKGRIRKTFKLPSGGDNSYPGLLIDDSKLWVSYYSSHDGKTSIYLTSIPLRELTAGNQ